MAPKTDQLLVVVSILEGKNFKQADSEVDFTEGVNDKRQLWCLYCSFVHFLVHYMGKALLVLLMLALVFKSSLNDWIKAPIAAECFCLTH